MPEFFWDVEQGSDDWHQLRCGLPTTSEFPIILRDGETSKTYQEHKLKKAGEILTGRPMESYTNWHHERGKQYEPLARDEWTFHHPDLVLERVGFVKNEHAGCSPDGLIAPNGGLEIKSMLPHLLLDVILKAIFPSKFKPQCQGGIWICEREWWDLAIFWPGLPLYLHRIYRDEPYIKRMESAVRQFNEEVAVVVEQVRSGKQPLPSLRDQLKASLLLDEVSP